MQLIVQDFAGKDYVVDVEEDDTTASIQEKVASATGLYGDSFCMHFGDEGEDITTLSAGGIITLSRTKKYDAITALHALGVDIVEETLVSVRDPEIGCLLLQAEVSATIPPDFLSGTEALHMNLSDPLCITSIGESFLSECDALTDIDLSGLHSVTTVGPWFLANCVSLRSVALFTPEVRVVQNFFFNCQALEKIDLSGLGGLTEIGDGFLQGCASLSHLDLSGLRRVVTVGENFLAECSSLADISFSGMEALTSIGGACLQGCEHLVTVDMTGLHSLQKVGIFLLFECPNLLTVRVSKKPREAVLLATRHDVVKCPLQLY